MFTTFLQLHSNLTVNDLTLPFYSSHLTAKKSISSLVCSMSNSSLRAEIRASMACRKNQPFGRSKSAVSAHRF